MDAARTGEPQQLPPHEVLDEIGRGRFGVVYRARDVAHDRIVALKVLAGDALTVEAARRFLQDAQAAIHLRLPHVIPLFAVGLHDGRPAYTMQLAANGRLSERIGQLHDARLAAGLVEKLARGAAAAHAHGLLHGDLKPAGVFFDEQDQPMIGEFGLTAQLFPRVEPAVDVRALGAILYELLTGRPPAEDAARPKRLRPDLHADLEAVVLCCLEKQPAERYPSARALADDLERWLRAEPTVVRPLTWTQRILRGLSRAADGRVS